ncbi:MAG: type II secretion system minor pseudopilin GspJ [Cellvibrionaceae bacterium]|nr:type II secretion system minor pseudopilin GspJ [Cellvibrionaceae bacterium]
MDKTGFTLIEMLVAVAITAAISTLAYRALDGALQADERVSVIVAQVDEVDRTWQYLANDLRYAVPRTWVNAYGDPRSAMIGVFGDRLSQSDVVIADESSYLLQFIRHNRDNLLARPRSDLYRVGYRLTQDQQRDTKTLWRDSWSPVEGSEAPVIQQRRLLAGIKTLRFRYLPAEVKTLKASAWLTGWPKNAVGANASLPAAVEINVELSELGNIVRLFSLTPAS